MSKVFLWQKKSHTGENVSAAYNQFSILQIVLFFLPITYHQKLIINDSFQKVSDRSDTYFQCSLLNYKNFRSYFKKLFSSTARNGPLISFLKALQ